MTRQQPITEGTWNRIARKHYRHINGAEVIYRPNSWNWEVIGGPNDGLRWTTLSAAQHFAAK
jgi:hypothetical protein